jgi:hypothetical protein
MKQGLEVQKQIKHVFHKQIYKVCPLRTGLHSLILLDIKLVND